MRPNVKAGAMLASGLSLMAGWLAAPYIVFALVQEQNLRGTSGAAARTPSVVAGKEITEKDLAGLKTIYELRVDLQGGGFSMAEVDVMQGIVNRNGGQLWPAVQAYNSGAVHAFLQLDKNNDRKVDAKECPVLGHALPESATTGTAGPNLDLMDLASVCAESGASGFLEVSVTSSGSTLAPAADTVDGDNSLLEKSYQSWWEGVRSSWPRPWAENPNPRPRAKPELLPDAPELPDAPDEIEPAYDHVEVIDTSNGNGIVLPGNRGVRFRIPAKHEARSTEKIRRKRRSTREAATRI
ncbi:unnamed protein product [Amoebophrya sp. A120]|nr:unnamed protein product [Amoebophrya sp. A120]|eukprot:GSA120T00025002001.1